MKSYAALAALCLACASQKSAESHSDYTGKVDTVRTEGAERVTVLEFGPLVPGSSLSHDGLAQREEEMPRPAAGEAPRLVITPESVSGSVIAAADLLPEHGPLLKATITETGPITTTTKASADAHADAESASKSRFGPGVLGWMACAAGAVLALLLAWKFRSGLLGSALKLIGKG